MNNLGKSNSPLARWVKHKRRSIFYLTAALVVVMGLTLAAGKTYQHWDNDKDRGAVQVAGGAFGEDYETPTYLPQGWDESDSLWFYTTTQGSNLLPYDFFLVLKEAGEQDELFRSDANIDHYRYLPQKPTFFNPDGLPVGFAKDEYQDKDYVGYTCAACHTGQVNYKGKAIRIDGGPAMANMEGFLTGLELSLKDTLSNQDKKSQFVQDVLGLENSYKTEEQVLADLELWTRIREQYNIINRSKVEYGYARLDAFGRIYNRVLQHVINRDQLKKKLLTIRQKPNGSENNPHILTSVQVDAVLDGINKTVISRDEFLEIIDRLVSTDSAENYPGLSIKEVLRIRDEIFNEPNAPVSYPFLWDTAHSDYVQWNGLANNAAAGPLGRNVGEVMGVFASLDWTAHKPWWKALDISARVSGQEHKSEVVKFKSSADLINLQRLESHLKHLTSPEWPTNILGDIDQKLADQGQVIYAEYCQSCHEIVQPNNWDRKIIAQMSSLESVQTDPAMAENSVQYMGSSGNFKHTYQEQGVGKIIIPEEAPVAVILTQATRGMVSTTDADKNWLRRQLDWLYVMAMSFFDNEIEDSIKNGDYQPDTTSKPFNSLLAYKARPLNGIWATAPYLHNGSVPSMYDLLLPVCESEVDSLNPSHDETNQQECRPTEFIVGSREYDPIKMGFKSEGYDGFRYLTDRRGNFNTGHEYAAGKTALPNGKPLPALTKSERMALIEFIKTL